jgi:hypothetical protein
MNNAITSSRPVKRLTRTLAGVLLLSMTVLTGTAVAEDTTASVDNSAYDAQMAGLKTSYGSMTSAMTAYYAANRGQAFGAYLADNPNAISRLSGASAGGNLTSLLSQAATMGSPGELDALLIQNGVGLDVSSWSSLGNAAADLQAKSQSIDAAVVNAGMSWAAALNMLTVPSVKNPGIPALDTTLATSMPSEGLAFGLFLNRSLATLIGNFPDVFAQVRATGVASPQANSAWRAAMENAGGASYTQLRNVVGTSACGTAFVNGLTGTNSNGCSPCAVAGMYGNAQIQLALAGGSTGGAANPVRSVTDLAGLSPESRAVASGASSPLSANLDQALAGGAGGCGSAAPAVKSAAAQSLPGIVGYLEGR